MKHRGKVRIGFTTGSAATAAAKAGVLFLATGKRVHRISIPCPEGHVRLVIPVLQYASVSDPSGPAIRVTVRKEAGDDPDATQGAMIVADLRLEVSSKPEIHLQGGPGVGTVTRPGLPVAVGHAAINPGPRRQMQRALLETLANLGMTARVRVLVEVPRGAELAEKTLNRRLGVLGGISILGTRGTVKAFSHAAWRDTIIQCLDVARAEGLDTVALCTGGRGQRFLEKALPEFPATAFIQAGDHPGFAIRHALRRGIYRIIWGGFWGKLVKIAQGRPQTHARLFSVDLEALAGVALRSGVDAVIAARIVQANTGRHALDLLRKSSTFEAVITAVMEDALGHTRRWGCGLVDIALILFDYDGHVLHQLGNPTPLRHGVAGDAERDQPAEP